MILDKKTVEKLEALALLMQKEPETVLHEALDSYLEAQQKQLVEDKLEEEKKLTTLSYDEFWDGLDLD